MKALISAFALLTFVASTALPVETYAQTTGTGQTMAPDTSTSIAPTTTTKEEEILKVPSCQKEIEEAVHNSDQLSQTKICSS